MPDAPVLAARNVCKSFSQVRVLESVRFEINKGEVRALVGENGAGKSTLVKIIAGVLRADSGEIEIEGKPVHFMSPREALDGGVSVIYQELDLIANLDGLSNIFLGFERFLGVKGFLDRKTMRRLAEDALGRLGVDIDLQVPVNRLPIAEQQVIAISKSLVHDTKILLMDEPSASLSGNELERLYELILALKSQGITIVYISHRLEEIFRIADSVTVLRDGNHIATSAMGAITKKELVELMIGKELEEKRINGRAMGDLGAPVLALNHISFGEKLKDISFDVRKGEIFGVLGLVGSGRNELAKLLYGMIKPDGGDISVHGAPVSFANPLQAIKSNISYVPEDRKAHGIIPNLSVELNVALSILYRLVNPLMIIKRALLSRQFSYFRDKLNIRIHSKEQLIVELSGGNQQKCVLSRCLALSNDIIVLNEPTRGIDVGAKFEIYQKLFEIAQEGKSLVLFSSEVPELTNLCDRIAIIKKGTITSIHEGTELEQGRILAELLG
jgi:ribose transport system ATP-binding protein